MTETDADVLEFRGFGKIPRLNRDMVITEKIDGTNAAVVIHHNLFNGKYVVKAQSRKRFITPEDDNYGFAAWVEANQEELIEVLGEGRHFGEWYGQGIQRNYGLRERRFALFNVSRFEDVDVWSVPGLEVVPVLYEGPFDTVFADSILAELAFEGSAAVPGYMNPEGIIVYHTAGNLLFKATIDNDDQPKSLVAA